MATRGPTELELSVLAGYKPPIKSIQSLRKDILSINQLTNALKSYRTKQDEQYLKRSVNLIIILSNVFEASTLEYALYAIMPKDLWPEVATLLFVFKLSTSRKHVDEDLIRLIKDLRVERSTQH
jgi:hypothetical protein